MRIMFKTKYYVIPTAKITEAQDSYKVISILQVYPHIIVYLNDKYSRNAIYT